MTGWFSTSAGNGVSRALLGGLAAIVALMALAAHLHSPAPIPSVASSTQVSEGGSGSERGRRPLAFVQAAVLDLEDLAGETIVPARIEPGIVRPASTALRFRSEARPVMRAAALPERPPRV